mgnify:CR=1 FL=1
MQRVSDFLSIYSGFKNGNVKKKLRGDIQLDCTVFKTISAKYAPKISYCMIFSYVHTIVGDSFLSSILPCNDRFISFEVLCLIKNG